MGLFGLFKKKSDETKVGNVEDFISLTRVYFQSVIATNLGITNIRFLPDVANFKRLFKVPTQNGKLRLAEKSASRKMLMQDYGLNENFRLNMEVVSAQFDAIREIASKEDCIFVGRCADYVLNDRDDVVSVFILGDTDARIKCLEERQGLDEAQARKKIKEVDKDRSSFYKYYSDQTWGDAQNYDLCINSSKLGVEGTVQTILSYIKARGLR